MHRSLLSAENALVWQSERHPDGWGVAYYVDVVPHLIKTAETALQDTLFRRVSGIVSSHTVVAHLRKATKGSNALMNSHPFQYGSWIFAHNGDVPRFGELRGELVARINPVLRRYILGDTDSEVFFYLMLTHMSNDLGVCGKTLHQRGVEPGEIIAAIGRAVREVEDVTGLCCYGQGSDDEEKLLLTFVLTNGEILMAHQGGKELFTSTYKVCCAERDICPSFGPSCEAPSAQGERVNHLVVSSEALHGENVWTAMRPGQVVGVDTKMRRFERDLNASQKLLPALAAST